MRWSRNRLARSNGFVVRDRVARSRRALPCTTRHVSRNTTPGTGTAARPVSMRISSLAGSELRSPTTIAGNERGRHSRTNSQSARTCSCRTAAVVVAPAQVRGEDLDRTARAGDLGEHAPVAPRLRRRPRPHLRVGAARTTWREIGQREITALPACTPSGNVRFGAHTEPSYPSSAASCSAWLWVPSSHTSCKPMMSASTSLQRRARSRVRAVPTGP